MNHTKQNRESGSKLMLDFFPKPSKIAFEADERMASPGSSEMRRLSILFAMSVSRGVQYLG